MRLDAMSSTQMESRAVPVLYDFPKAPSPRRARILLAEKGIPHETVIIDMAVAEQLGDAYRAINPDCTLPALRLDDGTVLTNNAAIAAWAEATYPDPRLMGTTPLQKAEIAGWLSGVEMGGMTAIAEALRNSNPAMKDRALPGPIDIAQIPALAERGLLRLRAFFEVLDRRLIGRDFVAGDQFSVVDIAALTVVDFARVVRIRPQESQAELLRWHENMSARPSASL